MRLDSERLQWISYPEPTEEMNRRWLRTITKYVPTVDLVDLSNETFPFNAVKR